MAHKITYKKTDGSLAWVEFSDLEPAKEYVKKLQNDGCSEITHPTFSIPEVKVPFSVKPQQ